MWMLWGLVGLAITAQIVRERWCSRKGHNYAMVGTVGGCQVSDVGRAVSAYFGGPGTIYKCRRCGNVMQPREW